MNKKYKYPRTYHFPFSPGKTSDDRVLLNTNHFNNKEIVVTEKMDGENITIYNKGCHARSIDSSHKSYHSWLLSWITTFSYIIADSKRICGEYLYAQHSIKYDNLEGYFLAFSVWDNDVCLSWDDTINYLEQLNIKTVPVLYRGIYDEKIIKEIALETVKQGGEGIVVRYADSFNYNDFSLNVAKYVRENHIQTDDNWKNSEIKKNSLKEKRN